MGLESIFLSIASILLTSVQSDFAVDGTDVGVGVRLVSGETFLQAKNSTSYKCD